MKSNKINTITGFLGTYSSPQSEGICRFKLDKASGALSVPELYCKMPDCKYLSLYKNLLAAPVKKETQAGISLLNIEGETFSPEGTLYEEDTTACFVTQDDDYIYTANYHQGLILIYQKTARGLLLHKRIEIAPGAGCHQILFHKHYMLVPCLLLDEIRILDRSRGYEAAGSIFFQSGTGPRHGIFTKDHQYFFVISELSNELYSFRVENRINDSAERDGDGLHLTLLSKIPLLSQEQNERATAAPASAAIRLSPDERYLYISTRFADILSVFRIEDGQAALIQQTGSGGIHPRDFVITEDGRFLLAANRTEGGLVCFPIDPGSGMIQSECSRVPAPEAVSIVLENQ